jgi:hypothetical protein
MMPDIKEDIKSLVKSAFRLAKMGYYRQALGQLPIAWWLYKTHGTTPCPKKYIPIHVR